MERVERGFCGKADSSVIVSSFESVPLHADLHMVSSKSSEGRMFFFDEGEFSRKC